MTKDVLVDNERRTQNRRIWSAGILDSRTTMVMYSDDLNGGQVEYGVLKA